MNKALDQARIAKEQGEVPIGAIVVDESGGIIGRGYNQVMQQKSQYAHAEVLAIANSGKAIGDWRLHECILYVTLEPCRMCFSLIQLSRCKTLVFGASSPIFGFQLDNDNIHSVYKNNTLTIVQEVSVKESVELLQTFFYKRRQKKVKRDEDRTSKKIFEKSQTGA